MAISVIPPAQPAPKRSEEEIKKAIDLIMADTGLTLSHREDICEALSWCIGGPKFYALESAERTAGNKQS